MEEFKGIALLVAIVAGGTFLGNLASWPIQNCRVAAKGRGLTMKTFKRGDCVKVVLEPGRKLNNQIGTVVGEYLNSGYVVQFPNMLLKLFDASALESTNEI